MKLGEYNFPFKSTGTLVFDPRKDHKKSQRWWLHLQCDEEIINLYCWFLSKKGIQIIKNKLWGAHISVIKGEEPTENKDAWGSQDGMQQEFWYGNYIRYDNGLHAWIDVLSPDLSAIREFYGVPAKGYIVKFHMTIGSIKGIVPHNRPADVFIQKDGIITI